MEASNDVSPFFSCFVFDGRHLGRLYAEVSLIHCWHGLGRNTPAILHQQCQTVILGRELEELFFLLNLRWGNWGDCMYACASSLLVSALLCPYVWCWIFSWRLSVPMEIRSQNYLDWKRPPEVTWPHLLTSTWGVSTSSPKTKLLVNKSCVPHIPPLHSKSVFSFVLQGTELLNCIPFCPGGVRCTYICVRYTHVCLCRSLIKINLDSSLFALYRVYTLKPQWTICI